MQILRLHCLSLLFNPLGSFVFEALSFGLSGVANDQSSLVVLLFHLGERVHKLNWTAAVRAPRGELLSAFLFHRHDGFPLLVVFGAALGQPSHQVDLVLRIVLGNAILFGSLDSLAIAEHESVILITLHLVHLPRVFLYLVLIGLDFDHHRGTWLVLFIDVGLSQTITLLLFFSDSHAHCELFLASPLFLVAL